MKKFFRIPLVAAISCFLLAVAGYVAVCGIISLFSKREFVKVLIDIIPLVVFLVTDVVVSIYEYFRAKKRLQNDNK